MPVLLFTLVIFTTFIFTPTATVTDVNEVYVTFEYDAVDNEEEDDDDDDRPLSSYLPPKIEYGRLSHRDFAKCLDQENMRYCNSI